MNMKKSIARKWVKALRSKKFKKGFGRLFEGGKHCPLGVLCAISPYKNNYTKMKVESGTSNIILPTKVMKWAGLEDCNPTLLNGHSVAYNNDECGYTLEQVADLIEETFILGLTESKKYPEMEYGKGT